MVVLTYLIGGLFVLNKPFKLIHKGDWNRYYYLNVNDVPYLATEYILKVPKDQRVKGGRAELTQSIKLLRVPSPLMIAFTKAIKMEPYETVENKAYFKEDHYHLLDIQTIRDEMQILYADVDPDYFPFAFPLEVANETISSLIKDGFLLLSVEYEGKFTRNTTLVRSDILGNIRIMEIVTAGKTGFDSVIRIETHTVDRTILKQFMEVI